MDKLDRKKENNNISNIGTILLFLFPTIFINETETEEFLLSLL